MPRVDLSVYELVTLSEAINLLAADLPEDDLEGVLRLSLIHRKLEFAARESVALDKLARAQEGYDF